MPETPTAPAPLRWIAHLDMDAFYASVELLRYPELKDQPVVIGGGRDHAPRQGPDGRRQFSRLRSYVGRGVITTATYPARALGVHSGMGLMKAAALAPDAILLPTDFEQYRHYSRRFKAAVAECAPVIEDRGIDEIYIDLTQVPGVQATAPDDPWAGVRAVAAALKAQVVAATGLRCSIGVTPNKLLSKLASDLDKPDGLTVFRHDALRERVWPLPAQRLNGIGPKANARLEALGIRTLGDLAGADPQWLCGVFGHHYGRWLHDAAHGLDDRPVVTHREPKSISRETTFERDLHAVADREALGAILTELCARLAEDLVRQGVRARTIGVKLRFDDFRTVTRDLTLESATAEAPTIRRGAGLCLKRVTFDRRLRLLGVRAAGLVAPAPEAPGGAGWGAGPEVAPLRAGESLPLFGTHDAG